jgi:fumarate hydratase, class II
VESVEVAHTLSERGEMALRRRSEDGALELRVNGVYVMDTVETTAERQLAALALARWRGSRPRLDGRVVVGGLGLGFTLAEVLGSPAVAEVIVAEIEPRLVAWHRAGLVPHTSGWLSDKRVRVVTADVAEVVSAQAVGTVDVLLLDVDNGPGNLVYGANAALYRAEFLRRCRRVMSSGGVTAIWSAEPSTPLRLALSESFEEVDEIAVPVRLGQRQSTYTLLLARAADARRQAFGKREEGRYRGKVSEQSTHDGEFRVERDTMGEVRVPASARWRAQTQRAVENFPISGQRLEPDHICALGLVKAAAAAVNAELGVLDDDVAKAIEQAATAVAGGEHDDQFPIDVFQTGSGTSSNMNANEVIASLASETLGRAVHPNDDVNASQSSNDTFPTAIHIAATKALISNLIPALDRLASSFEAKADEFAGLVKSGRTHLMDATPVTVGQEFGGYAAQLRLGIERVQSVLPRVAELPLGGTAVGTGINTPPGFAARVIERLAQSTGLPLREARNHFEAQGSRDSLVEASGQLRTVAVSVHKICTDLRWMGSGPRAGLGEIRLPDLQPGSSIMPGKVNPVLPEAMSMVCAQVIGNDAAVAFAGSSGNFELNVMMPVMATNLLGSIRLLSNALRVLAERCVDGIEVNIEHCRELAESSPSIVTPLNRYLGYENAAAVAKRAVKERRTIREVVIEDGYLESGALTEAQLDEALDVLRMTHP